MTQTEKLCARLEAFARAVDKLPFIPGYLRDEQTAARALARTSRAHEAAQAPVQRGLFRDDTPREPIYIPHNGTATSRAAASGSFESGGARSHRARILGMLCINKEWGYTSDEIETAYERLNRGSWHTTVSPRLKDLVDAGHASCDGSTRTTRLGREAQVYTVTPAGIEQHERDLAGAK